MNYYLDKHAYYPQKIADTPEHDLGIVVVIPAFCEPNLISSLQSLKDCIQPICAVEIIVVINHSIEADENIVRETNKMIGEVRKWILFNNNRRLKFFVISACDLPVKTAGVGLARKIGMDEAVRRFQIVGNHKGIICCFDADSKCDNSYFTAIEEHFKRNSKATACSIYFEHPLLGDDFPAEVYSGIMNYELHLRYYISGLRYAGHPFAYHTIGSSMAVRSDIYQKQGGMNKRKAGEDFYFLHKIIPLGNFSELSATKVIPSPRPSERVPFGTGRAINSWLDNKSEIFLTYHPQVFQELKFFLERSGNLYFENFEAVYTEPISLFLSTCGFNEKLIELRKNAKDQISFNKRFYNWFDGFRALKFIHFMRDNFYSNVNLKDASLILLQNIQKKKYPDMEINMIVNKYRKIDLLGNKDY